ncbi:hypothetical protein SAMN06295900_11969 [Trinickia caryophylli]|uniref:Uncharacterized protein n=1 Tax=Trinickia caryophylli TaxID=28094 RepID=A0A1X7GYX6_TRICW|nr:hypothetical protein SAMN06295900_11969 [Trinickia caryophylli]
MTGSDRGGWGDGECVGGPGVMPGTRCVSRERQRAQKSRGEPTHTSVVSIFPVFAQLCGTVDS